MCHGFIADYRGSWIRSCPRTELAATIYPTIQRRCSSTHLRGGVDTSIHPVTTGFPNSGTHGPLREQILPFLVHVPLNDDGRRRARHRLHIYGLRRYFNSAASNGVATCVRGSLVGLSGFHASHHRFKYRGTKCPVCRFKSILVSMGCFAGSV